MKFQTIIIALAAFLIGAAVGAAGLHLVAHSNKSTVSVDAQAAAKTFSDLAIGLKGKSIEEIRSRYGTPAEDKPWSNSGVGGQLLIYNLGGNAKLSIYTSRGVAVYVEAKASSSGK